MPLPLLFPLLVGVGAMSALWAFQPPGPSFVRTLRKPIPNRLPTKITDPSPLVPATPAGWDPVEENKKTNRRLVLSLTGLGIAGGAALANTPYTWLALPFFIDPLVPFARKAYRGLRHERRLNMAAVDMVMIAGVVATGQLVTMAFLAFLLSGTDKLIKQAEDRSHRCLRNDFFTHDKTVWVLLEGSEIEIPFEDLKTADTVVIHPGDIIPADGRVLAGAGTVDQRLLTGEAQPVEKTVGDPLIAATTLLNGQLQMRVERSGQDTMAAQIGQMLDQASDYRQHLQWQWLARVDRWALPTLVSGVATYALFGPIAAIAMLFAMGGIGGYAMRVVAPFQLFSVLHQASQTAILVKDGRIMEQLHDIDTVVFDKTGTLTEDRLQVAAIHGFISADETWVLTQAAIAEYRQQHPIAQAIIGEADSRGIKITPPEGRAYEWGLGIQVRHGERLIHVGSARFIADQGIALPETKAELETRCHRQGLSMVWVAVQRQVVGAIELRPTLRTETCQVIANLKARGLSLCILSGDRQAPTQHLAEQLGIDYFAEVLPNGKAAIIEQLQSEGHRVCFVGDGVNDTLALNRADVSVSLRGAATIATDTAQVVLMSQSLKDLPQLFKFADKFRQDMEFNVKLTAVPQVVGAGGVILFHTGLIPVIVLYYLGMGLGVVQASWPLLERHVSTSNPS